MANKGQALSPMTNFKAEIRIPTYFIEAYLAALGFKTFSDQFREQICGELRACPPEDQAEVIHAISPISVKLGQIEGHTQ